MKKGEYGVRYESMTVSPMNVNERAMVRNAKHEFNRKTGQRLSNREFRKHLLIEGSKRILTELED